MLRQQVIGFSRRSRSALTIPCLCGLSQNHQQQQYRSNYQIFLEQKVNPKTKKVEIKNQKDLFPGANLDFHADPEESHLLQYEKPWMKRKRKKLNKVVLKREQTVEDLLRFIKKKREWERHNR